MKLRFRIGRYWVEITIGWGFLDFATCLALAAVLGWNLWLMAAHNASPFVCFVSGWLAFYFFFRIVDAVVPILSDRVDAASDREATS